MDANYQGKELKGTQNAHRNLNKRYALPCFTFNPYPGATMRDKPFLVIRIQRLTRSRISEKTDTF